MCHFNGSQIYLMHIERGSTLNESHHYCPCLKSVALPQTLIIAALYVITTSFFYFLWAKDVLWLFLSISFIMLL